MLEYFEVRFSNQHMLDFFSLFGNINVSMYNVQLYIGTYIQIL